MASADPRVTLGARVANVAAMSAIASLLVGVAVLFAACSGSDSRPVIPKSPVAESAPVSVPLAAAFPALDKALEKQRVADDVPGVVVGVVIDGELAYARGFGIVDPATKAV